MSLHEMTIDSSLYDRIQESIARYLRNVRYPKSVEQMVPLGISYHFGVSTYERMLMSGWCAPRPGEDGPRISRLVNFVDGLAMYLEEGTDFPDDLLKEVESSQF